jgi:uncharacterized protein YraI
MAMIRRSAIAAVAFVLMGATPAAAAYVCGTNPRSGDGFLAMRTCPDTSCTILHRLWEGTNMKIIDQRGRWFYVYARGDNGWVHSRYVCG